MADEIVETRVLTVRTKQIATVDRPVTTVVRTTTPEAARVVTATRQGPPGPPGGTVLHTTGQVAISGHTAVCIAADGTLAAADCTDPTHLGTVIGVTPSASAPGAPTAVQSSLSLVHAGWTFSPGPVFVGTAGALVQTLPVGAVFSQVVGFAVTATRIVIDIQPPVLL